MSNGKEFAFKCTHCNTTSVLSLDELKKASMEKNVLLECGNPDCGAWNLTDKPKGVNNTISSDGAQICECIKFTGPEAKLPRGKNIYADGTVVYGTGDDAELLTREDYVLKYAIDPEVTLKKMWDGRIKPPLIAINPGFKHPLPTPLGLVAKK